MHSSAVDAVLYGGAKQSNAHASLQVYGEMVGVTEGVTDAVAVDDAPRLPL